MLQFIGRFRRFAVLNIGSDLNGSQLELHRKAMEFARTELRPHAKEWEQQRSLQVCALQKAAKLGFAGVLTDERFGGLGRGRVEATVILEALAYGCMDVAALVGVQNLCGAVICDKGSEEQKEKWLRGVTEAVVLTSFCLTEPESGSDAGSIRTKAEKKNGDFVINGRKSFITGAGMSDLYLVMCKTGPKETSCILVPNGTKGLSFSPPDSTMGWRGHTASVFFSDVTVPQSNLVGQLGEGLKGALKALTGARLNMASISIGGAAFALDQTLQYMAGRKQFGQSLKDMQSLRFRMADCATELIAARILVRESAKAVDEMKPEAGVLSAMAKRVGTETGFKIADVALQMHGGYGNLQSHEIERVFRDLRINRIVEGSTEIMKLLIARHLFTD